MLEFIRNRFGLRSGSSGSTSQNTRPEVKIEVTPAEVDGAGDAEDRVQWKSPVQFFMTILGFCVGLGNIWRFPYLCQKNGGGMLII